METLTLVPPSQVLLRSSSPAPAEPMDPNRGLRALTQEEVRGMQVWPQGQAESTYCVLGPVKVEWVVDQASPCKRVRSRGKG